MFSAAGNIIEFENTSRIQLLQPVRFMTAEKQFGKKTTTKTASLILE